MKYPNTYSSSHTLHQYAVTPLPEIISSHFLFDFLLATHKRKRGYSGWNPLACLQKETKQYSSEMCGICLRLLPFSLRLDSELSSITIHRPTDNSGSRPATRAKQTNTSCGPHPSLIPVLSVWYPRFKQGWAYYGRRHIPSWWADYEIRAFHTEG